MFFLSERERISRRFSSGNFNQLKTFLRVDSETFQRDICETFFKWKV